MALWWPLAEAVRYEVSVATGWHENSGSTTPVSIQFVGTRGSSAEYDTGLN